MADVGETPGGAVGALGGLGALGARETEAATNKAILEYLHRKVRAWDRRSPRGGALEGTRRGRRGLQTTTALRVAHTIWSCFVR